MKILNKNSIILLLLLSSFPVFSQISKDDLILPYPGEYVLYYDNRFEDHYIYGFMLFPNNIFVRRHNISNYCSACR